MAPLLFNSFFKSKDINLEKNITGQAAGHNPTSLMPNSVDSNNQFNLTEIQTITFGVITIVLTLIGLVFAALQLRAAQHRGPPDLDMQSPHTNEREFAVSSPCKFIHFIFSVLCTQFFQQTDIRAVLSQCREAWTKTTTVH
jgi:hypothetical protein